MVKKSPETQFIRRKEFGGIWLWMVMRWEAMMGGGDERTYGHVCQLFSGVHPKMGLNVFQLFILLSLYGYRGRMK